MAERPLALPDKADDRRAPIAVTTFEEFGRVEGAAKATYLSIRVTALLWLIGLTFAEVITVFVDPSWGTLCHAVLAGAAIALAGLAAYRSLAEDHTLAESSRLEANFLVALALAPIVRVVTLVMPREHFSRPVSDGAVTLCVLGATWAAMRANGYNEARHASTASFISAKQGEADAIVRVTAAEDNLETARANLSAVPAGVRTRFAKGGGRVGDPLTAAVAAAEKEVTAALAERTAAEAAVANAIQRRNGWREAEPLVRWFRPRLPLDLFVAGTGVIIGLVEYRMWRPEGLVDGWALNRMLIATLVVVAVAGISEELMLRGVIQVAGTALFGSATAITFVAVIFAIMHFGYRSWQDVSLAFAIAVWYGLAVRFTKSLVGASVGHGIANVCLFIAFPLLLN